jgi:antitoxin MazE
LKGTESPEVNKPSRFSRHVSTLLNRLVIGMKSTIKKWGNSAAIRIPAAVMKAVEFDLDEIVDVREEEGRIIIEPVRQKAYDLHALLKGITPKNQHQAADFGPALGEEVW